MFFVRFGFNIAKVLFDSLPFLKMKKYILLFAVALFLFSCKSRTAVASDGGSASDSLISVKDLPKGSNMSVENHVKFYENILIHPKFDQLKIYSKIDMESNNAYIPTMDATTYIEKDKKVWMNISLFLFSAARGIATPDGIKAYSKTDKKYIDSDFGYLNNLLNTNFIDYRALEKLLTGRTFVKVNSSNFRITKNRDGYQMSSIANQKIENEGNSREYRVDLSYSNSYDLMHVRLQDINSADELEVDYANWTDFADFRLPKNVKINIKGSKPAKISLENTKFDSSKMQTPFNVPANYTKIEI